MMDDDRRGRLFGVKHEFVGQINIDTLGSKQFKKLGLVFDIRTRRIAKAETRALVSLVKKFGEFGGVISCNAEFLADSLVPHFG